MIPPMGTVVHLVDRAAPGDLLDQLSLLAGEGERIVSAGPPPRRGGFDLPVVAAHRPLGPPALGEPWLARKVRRADVVHAWSPSAAQAGEALAERLGARLFVSLPAAQSADGFGPVVRDVAEGLSRATLLVPTASARRLLRASGVPSRAVAVLPCPARPPETPRRRRMETRGALGLGADERLVVALGEMARPAGHKYASWAHAIVRQVLGDVRLLLPGTGPIERHVEFFAGTTGYDDEVFLTGDHLGRSDVLCAADLGVFYCERDCGVSALAGAMAAGLPIAASATPDVSECAPHEVAALLSPPGNPMAASAALLRLLKDSELAARLGAAARRLAGEQFDPGRCRARLEAIYAAPPGAEAS